MASPEYAALQRSTGTLCENISAATTPTWFAQKLQGRGLITPQLQDRTLTLGVADYDKVSKLLQAVLTQVKANSGKFRELMDILGEEPALETSVIALTKALEGIPTSDSSLSSVYTYVSLVTRSALDAPATRCRGAVGVSHFGCHKMLAFSL